MDSTAKAFGLAMMAAVLVSSIYHILLHRQGEAAVLNELENLKDQQQPRIYYVEFPVLE